MRLLYSDESNLNPNNTEFFVYAGVVIDCAKAAALSADITKLRTRLKLKSEDLLKFNTREKPDSLTIEEHTAAKKSVMELAAKHGVVLIASMILHDLAKSPDVARLNEINRVCYHFHSFLARVDDSGLVLIDNFSDPELPKLIRQRFAVGLTGSLPYSNRVPLNRIVGYHMSSIGCSHFCSVIDIVLGALRFALNNRRDEHRKDTVAEIMNQIRPLCFREDSGDVSELSLFCSPKRVARKDFHNRYMSLQQFFRDHGMPCAQVVPNETKF